MSQSESTINSIESSMTQLSIKSVETTDKKQANLVNRTMVSILLNKDRRASQTIKKFIHMKRFLKLCKSESFKQYFWNPNNMGGRWNIRYMTKMNSY